MLNGPAKRGFLMELSLNMKEIFIPFENANNGIPRAIRYGTQTQERVFLQFGSFLGSPAVSFTVTDRDGRVLKQGNSCGFTTYEEALIVGLGQKSPRGVTLLRHYLGRHARKNLQDGVK